MDIVNTKETIYSDIDIGFRTNKISNDLIIKRNVLDIQQSIRLLLMTKFYNRKWHPEIGSYIKDFLFSQNDEITANILKNQIEVLLGNNEPRIKINTITVKNINDNKDIKNSGIKIRIEYTILILNQTDTFEYVINRLR